MIGVNKKQAQDHYDSLIDKPFPTGFTFKHSVFIQRVTGKGTLSQSDAPDLAHGWEQPYERCSYGTMNIGMINDGSIINSKSLRRDFREKIAKLLPRETILALRNANTCIRIIGTTSVLEGLVK